MIPIRISPSTRDALFWVQDAYTTSDRYPRRRSADARGELHSQFDQGGHRHLSRDDDVLPGGSRRIRWRQRSTRRFRHCCVRSARCRRGCARGCAYPQLIFAIQAGMFSTYHMDNPAVFYNKEDQWEVPTVGRRHADAAAADGAVLLDHAAAGRERRGIHPDAAVHAAAEGQPRRVDGGAQRRRALRQADGVPVPEAEGDLSGRSR